MIEWIKWNIKGLKHWKKYKKLNFICCKYMYKPRYFITNAFFVNPSWILLWLSVHTFEYFYKCSKKKNIYVCQSFESVTNFKRDTKSTAEIPAVQRQPFPSIINEKFGAKVCHVTSITRRTHHFDSKRQAKSTSIIWSSMSQVLWANTQTYTV